MNPFLQDYLTSKKNANLEPARGGCGGDAAKGINEVFYLGMGSCLLLTAFLS